MRYLSRKAVGAATGILVAALFMIALLSPSLLTAQQFSPRLFNTQQVHYIRFPMAFNSCVLSAGTCSFKVGAVPYNSFVKFNGFQLQVVTAFNSGTTDVIGLGTTSANGNEILVATTNVHTGATAVTNPTLQTTGTGTQVTGNGITSTGSNGGFDLWVKYTQTGAAPTAGLAIGILEYYAPNDGSCTNVGLGATATGC